MPTSNPKPVRDEAAKICGWRFYQYRGGEAIKWGCVISCSIHTTYSSLLNPPFRTASCWWPACSWSRRRTSCTRARRSPSRPRSSHIQCPPSSHWKSAKGWRWRQLLDGRLPKFGWDGDTNFAMKFITWNYLFSQSRVLNSAHGEGIAFREVISHQGRCLAEDKLQWHICY